MQVVWEPAQLSGMGEAVSYDDYEKAVGAVLVRVEAQGDGQISLVTNKGTLHMWAGGDCCSHSWFESHDSDAEGGTITKFEETYGERTESADYDVLQTYFGTVYTTKGRVTYELRNSSNGYYGGYVNWTWVPDMEGV